MNTKTNLAYALAEHAHAGQKYGEHDYFEYHVLGVANNFSGKHRWDKGKFNPDSKCTNCDINRVDQFYSNDHNYCKNHNEEAYIVALLHDVLEDSDIDYHTIYNCFGVVIAEAVLTITNVSETGLYENYIKNMTCSNTLSNRLATKVKIADLKFHLSQPVIRNEKRYRAALELLEGTI